MLFFGDGIFGMRLLGLRYWSIWGIKFIRNHLINYGK
jgi:hypothetical protein